MTLTKARPDGKKSGHFKPEIDLRVLAANRMAAELLKEEAERSSSPMLKFLVRVATFALAVTLWWIAVKLILRV